MSCAGPLRWPAPDAGPGRVDRAGRRVEREQVRPRRRSCRRSPLEHLARNWLIRVDLGADLHDRVDLAVQDVGRAVRLVGVYDPGSGRRSPPAPWARPRTRGSRASRASRSQLDDVMVPDRTLLHGACPPLIHWLRSSTCSWLRPLPAAATNCCALTIGNNAQPSEADADHHGSGRAYRKSTTSSSLGPDRSSKPEEAEREDGRSRDAISRGPATQVGSGLGIYAREGLAGLEAQPRPRDRPCPPSRPVDGLTADEQRHRLALQGARGGSRRSAPMVSSAWRLVNDDVVEA